MTYQPKKFDQLLGAEGFSEKALQTHFTLYEGYVKNTNLLLEKLAELRQEGKNDTPMFAEMKRRFGWEFNGMRLHEYYFSAMTKDAKGLDDSSALAQKITEDFGSVEEWKKDFLATASARGIGWTILAYDSIGKKLINLWVNEHDVGHMAGTHVLLPLDVFEHAFIIDYGTKKADYLSAFMRIIDWSVVDERYQSAAK